MRLAFLCSSLEPGRDGVGDYTRRLAGELTREGHASIAVALNEAHLDKATRQQQEIEGVSIDVLRLPDTMTWSQRIVESAAFLRGHTPDWLSLQFVPFGFHPRGLCFGLGKSLATLAPGAPWQIMFHELWLGLGARASLKDRIWGRLQKGIALDAVRRLEPAVVHTQAEPYRLALEAAGVKATILPLFGNIPRQAGDGAELIQSLLAKQCGAVPDRDQVYLAGVLGGVHREWCAEDAVNIVLPLAQKSRKRLILVFLGRNHLSSESFDQLKASVKGRAEVIVAGERPAEEISRLLQCLDLGLATTPLEVIQKSGSAAAMLDHGLSVLVTRNDWHLRGAETPVPVMDPRVLTPREFVNLKALPRRQSMASVDNGVQSVAQELLTSLRSENVVRA
jgi:hypothetical protein